ncbi:aminotransferase class IV [Shivajiella indica]|uniref:branched-chain-amino-acid transaminase n=1 Tax=Shivajiella indica TaxID=872115 RepID=A0ABW5BC71_9BACT
MNGFGTTFLFKQKNGEWSTQPLAWHNRGFLFGDGLFETMVFQSNKIRFSDDHQLRVLDGIANLSLDREELSSIQQIEKTVNHFFPNSKALRIRWNIFRAGYGRYSPPENSTHETLQIESFIKSDGLKINAFVSDKIRIPELPWSNCKTLNSLTYVLANQERIDKKMDEVILLNSKGLVSEAGSSNIFWIKNGVYYTPSLTCSCISGIGRKQIIRKLETEGKEIVEGEFYPIELVKADKIFTSNAIGVSYIQFLNNWEFDIEPDPIIDEIFQMN